MANDTLLVAPDFAKSAHQLWHDAQFMHPHAAQDAILGTLLAAFEQGQSSAAARIAEMEAEISSWKDFASQASYQIAGLQAKAARLERALTEIHVTAERSVRENRYNPVPVYIDPAWLKEIARSALSPPREDTPS